MDRLEVGMIENGSKPLKDVHFVATAMTTQDALNGLMSSLFKKPCVVNGCVITTGNNNVYCSEGTVYFPLYGLVRVEAQSVNLTGVENWHPKLTYSESYYAPLTDNDGNTKQGIRKRTAILSYIYYEGDVVDSDTYLFPENNVTSFDSFFAKDRDKVTSSKVTITTTKNGQSATLKCYRDGNMLCINGNVLFPNDQTGTNMDVDTQILPLMTDNQNVAIDIVANCVKIYEDSSWNFNYNSAVLTLYSDGKLKDDKALGLIRLISVSSVILW